MSAPFIGPRQLVFSGPTGSRVPGRPKPKVRAS